MPTSSNALEDTMAWAKPAYDIPEVNRAGRVLASVGSEKLDLVEWTEEEWDRYNRAAETTNNWRGSHAYPLNTFQIYLRETARRFEKNPLVAQRIKRLYSIVNKLERFPSMKLSQMQDLGGCRAILGNVTSVAHVFKYYLTESSIKHKLVSTDDYIGYPKDSGYRGVHLVYRYISDKNKKMYNGMKIEIQLRSRFQHAWATAVETVGMFSGQALKSSLGSDEWRRFFSLMGSVIAVRENTPLVPGTPQSRKDLINELRVTAERLQVESRLSEYNKALHSIASATKNARYYLLELDPDTRTLVVTGYGSKEGQEAVSQYAAAEKAMKNQPGSDTVLVSVESVSALAKAYPNYFADTRLFLILLRQALEGRNRPIRLSDLKFGNPTPIPKPKIAKSAIQLSLFVD